jgi:hypothetical protein
MSVVVLIYTIVGNSGAFLNVAHVAAVISYCQKMAEYSRNM